MSRKSLQAGYCDDPEDYCALEKSDCTDSSNFLSSREMQGAPERAHGGVCLLQESIIGFPLGECGEGTCSPNAESCTALGGTASSLYGDIPYDGKTCLVEETKFGRCNDRCSWSPDDCDFGEDWFFPSSDCSCDKVRVGGCVKDDVVFCAVSPNACDSLSTWLTPKEVENDTDYLCFLCREVSLPPGNGGGNGTGGGNGNGSGGGNGSGDGNGGGNAQSQSSSSSKNSQTSVIVGAAVGVFLGFALLSVAVVYTIRRRKQNKTWG